VSQAGRVTRSHTKMQRFPFHDNGNWLNLQLHTPFIALQTASACKLQFHSFIVTPSQPRGPAPLNAITKIGHTTKTTEHSIFY
jgi:hypothetical protein